MSRRFTVVTVVLAAVVAFLVGVIVAGGFERPAVIADAPPPVPEPPPDTRPAAIVPHRSVVDFADVVGRVNAAVVNINATVRGHAENGTPRRRGDIRFDVGGLPGVRDVPRRGAGSGFVIDADGSILTNHHVIERAERILVKLSDGRSLRARVIGSDPDTDIALIKVDGQQGLPVAPLGDSSTLRMGEWVCAIGNPLGYEHSVTVGVVSFIGRKLFDSSLGDYIQTDAAINFGNSGGPLINARGEVVGINAAVNSRGSSIGFAVPINEASGILPQLRRQGFVSRGYIGISVRGLDEDLRRSLALGVSQGALVQDVTPESPALRAGLRPYDVIVSVEDRDVDGDEELTRAIAGRAPGTFARLLMIRNGREQTVTVKIAERPTGGPDGQAPGSSPVLSAFRSGDETRLGLTVRDLDAGAFNRYALPSETRGVLVTRVEPFSPAYDGSVERGTVLLEINRRAVTNAVEYRRIVRAARAGEVLALYVFSPEIGQRLVKTVRVDDR